MNYSIYLNTKKLNPNDAAAIAEYSKRLSAYCTIRLVCKPIKALEPFLIKQNFSDHTCCYQVLPGTDTYTSEDFAGNLDQLGIHGTSSVYFFIGYPVCISMSPIHLSSMELSTGLSGVVLYEQLYRSYRILNPQPYHK